MDGRGAGRTKAEPAACNAIVSVSYMTLIRFPIISLQEYGIRL